MKLPDDLAAAGIPELTALAAEVRRVIIETVSRNGGHLAANLGVVELTLALLKVFRPPADRILWDVGHQTYAYKVLTGRLERFDSLRKYGGLSGFQRRDESPYDAFGAGHSGTALSAALGMAVARDRRGGGEHVVAIVGDGAVGNGISLEAFNNIADTTERLVVVLNDNEMSIAANVGALSRHLGSLLANPLYNRWKRKVESAAARLRMGWLRKAYYRVEEAIKGLFLRGVIFEEFGLRYVGPIDGHNLHALIDALTVARDSGRRVLVHVSTCKGKGYVPAENEPERWHGAIPFDIETSEPLQPKDRAGYSDVFGEVLTRLAAADRRIVAITAAMPKGTGLSPFAASYPDRFFDVGISEEHAAVFAAGLAAEGLVPVFAVYATFAQRVVDQVLHDICLQNLPVVLCLDRAGVVGDDGPTHHGVFDIAEFRTVPGLTMMQPADEVELARMLKTAIGLGTPAIIRYPRAVGPGLAVPAVIEPLPVGKADVRREGGEVVLWALGDMLPVAETVAGRLAAAGVAAGVVNARFIKPLDRSLLAAQAPSARCIVTLENGVAAGGFGAAVAEELAGLGYRGTVLRIGWPDAFVPHGEPERLFALHGLDAESVLRRVQAALG